MCGITAIYRCRHDAPAIDRERLRSVRDYMYLRGPDAAGEWYSNDGLVGLAHRRLKIIDLDSRANQPMLTPDGVYAIIFNGEIYNYHSLRKELEAVGHQFTTSSDTEVLLFSFLQWGDKIFSRLRGMYAFAIWDGGNKRLLVGRDPYGIKPLYYANDGKTLRLASQVKALQAGGEVNSAVDPAGMVGFLLTGSVPEPHTIYRGIKALPAGHALWANEQGVSEPWSHSSVAGVWHSAANNSVICNSAELREHVRNALVNTVSHHLIADVPVGAFLSAGIDSGALVGLMTESGQETQTVTLGFDEFKGTKQDETVLAASMSSAFGTKHTVRWIDDREVEQDLPSILDAMDQPSVDGINTWLVSKAAHDLGLKVVVSGVGGDELFGGYATFEELPRWRKHLHRLGKVPGIKSIGLPLSRSLSSRGWLHPKIPGLLDAGDNLKALYRVRRGLFLPWELEQLFDAEFIREGLASLNPPGFISADSPELPDNDFAAVAVLEGCGYLRNQLLRDSDWASMAHSLELRTPLVDYTLLKTLAPLLVNRPQGWQAKEALAFAPQTSLPLQVVNRTKTGFSLPMKRWLSQSQTLDAWRKEPALAGPNVHWSRQMAYSLASGLIK